MISSHDLKQAELGGAASLMTHIQRYKESSTASFDQSSSLVRAKIELGLQFMVLGGIIIVLISTQRSQWHAMGESINRKYLIHCF